MEPEDHGKAKRGKKHSKHTIDAEGGDDEGPSGSLKRSAEKKDKKDKKDKSSKKDRKDKKAAKADEPASAATDAHGDAAIIIDVVKKPSFLRLNLDKVLHPHSSAPGANDSPPRVSPRDSPRRRRHGPAAASSEDSGRMLSPRESSEPAAAVPATDQEKEKVAGKSSSRQLQQQQQADDTGARSPGGSRLTSNPSEGAHASGVGPSVEPARPSAAAVAPLVPPLALRRASIDSSSSNSSSIERYEVRATAGDAAGAPPSVIEVEFENGPPRNWSPKMPPDTPSRGSKQIKQQPELSSANPGNPGVLRMRWVTSELFVSVFRVVSAFCDVVNFKPYPSFVILRV
eukprot:TRINITY_DN675_c1_g1_i1.p1 TRINITY_DN675_c1_g1~~TRINITY_DN675_c1_g1_i1.p1  ORF type:complete len:343 (-),score=110.55 TRINITY_DN675_c1_g1_i1:104-1132(-)